MASRIRVRGFTLLEIMLVLVLLGLVFSTILPSLPVSDGSAAIKKESQRLLQYLQMAREQALAKGQDLGLELTDDGYRLLAFKKNRWVVAEEKRLLAPVKINPALHLGVIAGESIWQESLDLESKHSFTLEDDDDSDSDEGSGKNDAESDLFAEEKTLQPTLIFWSFGNLSPASVRISSEDKDADSLVILIEESGIIALQDEESKK